MATKVDLKYNDSIITSITAASNKTILLTSGQYCSSNISAKLAIDYYNGYVITGISVGTPPAKTSYHVGDALDLTGMVILDNSNNDITSDCIFSPANGAILTASDVNILITYSELTCNQPITMEKSLIRLEVTTPPTKTDYNIGDTLDLTGIAVTGIYNDSSTEDVTNLCTYNPASGTILSVAGLANVAISYSGVSVIYSVKVYNTDNTTYLYYHGNEQSDITGGWSGFARSYPVGFNTNSSLNTTNYSKLISVYIFTGNDNVGGGAYAGIPPYDVTRGAALIGGDNFNRSGTIQVGVLDIFSNNQLSYLVSSGNVGYGTPSYSKQSVNLYMTYNYSGYYNTLYVYASALAKSDDISGLSSYGSTISEILANSATLLEDKNAVIYMALNCSGDLMWSALGNSTFMTALASSSYKDILYSSTLWDKALQTLNHSL